MMIKKIYIYILIPCETKRIINREIAHFGVRLATGESPKRRGEGLGS